MWAGLVGSWRCRDRERELRWPRCRNPVLRCRAFVRWCITSSHVAALQASSAIALKCSPASCLCAHQDAKSLCSRIRRCRRLAYTCLDTHCQQVLRAKHLVTSATTKTPIAQIQKHHIRATKQKHHSGARTENNTTAERKDKRTTAKRKHKGTTAWETLVGSSTKAAFAAVTLESRHTPLHEHGVSPDEEKRLECARCCRARATRCCRARGARCYRARQCGDGACRCCRARAARCYRARPARVLCRLS